MRSFSHYLSGAIILVLTGNLAQADEWSIDQLVSLLAQAGASKARVTEKQYLSTLDVPLELSGELLYTPPDVMEKRTLKPKPETMRLAGSTMTLERGKHRYTLDVDDSPEIAALVQGMRATLAGNLRALERHYSVQLQGTREQWQLQLTPGHASARQKIRRITLAGSEGAVQTVEVLQPDGDYSLMRIEPVQP